MHFSLATIAFDRESAQMSQILSSQGKKRTFKPLSSLVSAFSNLKEMGASGWGGAKVYVEKVYVPFLSWRTPRPAAEP